MRTGYLVPSFVACLMGLPFTVTSGAQTSASVTSIAANGPTGEPANTAPGARRRIAKNYGKLPISFEANRGQTDKRVQFLARGSGYGLYLNGQEAVLALHAPRPGETRSGTSPLGKAGQPWSVKTDVVRMQLRGANPAAQPEGVDPLPGTANYFIGKDPSTWHTAIPTYSRVKFSGVYPGVDLVYYGNQSQLEYDFVVAPRANPKAIRLHFAGASNVALTAGGDLFVSTRNNEIAFHKPVIHQEMNGQRQTVEGRFAVQANHSVSFVLGSYDRSQPLIIDPVLAYSTYLGGSQWTGANAVAVDSSGNAYVAGFTFASDFPVTPGVLVPTHSSGPTGFVTKLNPTGTALVYSTYFDTGNLSAIAVDGAGDAYVTGEAGPGFPVTPGAFQTVDKTSNYTGFITELNPLGTALVFSTYLGGKDTDYVNTMTLDGFGDIYVAGSTQSGDFPVTPGAFQKRDKTANFTGFVAELNPAGSALVFSTFLGGNVSDNASAIAVDGSGDVYVAGSTFSGDFPVTHGAFQTSYIGNGIGFITKLNSTGTGLVYSTYLGGSGTNYGGDGVSAIAVDGSGDAYVTGSAQSLNFPVTPGAFQTTNETMYLDGTSAFITELNPAGSALVYSTYLGGTASAGAGCIAVDGSGDAYVAGSTTSLNFPVTPGAFQTVNEAGYYGSVFVTELNPTGSALLYSTFFDGTMNAIPNGMVLDASGDLYLAGQVRSYDFPVTADAFQTMNNIDNSLGDTDGFVAKLNLGSTRLTYITVTKLDSSSNSQVVGQPVSFTAKVKASGASGPPTGNVVILINQNYVTTIPLNSEGMAVYSTSTLGQGETGVQASYLGGGDFGPSGGFEFQVMVSEEAPIFSPAPGTYGGSVVVKLSDINPSATIHYTLDGTAPNGASPLYTNPITFQAGYTLINAIAIAGGNSSDVSHASYSVVPLTPTPVFSQPSGSYPVGQPITITDAIPTATIRYTTDGSIPTTHSSYYHEPIVLTGSETINAIAISTYDETSEVASATYTTP
jgi:hypothetical protein